MRVRVQRAQVQLRARKTRSRLHVWVRAAALNVSVSPGRCQRDTGRTQEPPRLCFDVSPVQGLFVAVEIKRGGKRRAVCSSDNGEGLRVTGGREDGMEEPGGKCLMGSNPKNTCTHSTASIIATTSRNLFDLKSIKK